MPNRFELRPHSGISFGRENRPSGVIIASDFTSFPRCKLPEGIATHGQTLSPEPELPDVLGMLHSFLRVPVSAFAKMALDFFPEIDLKNLPERSVERHYNTYRFHSKPGHVVQTFTVIKSPVRSRSFSMFSNFFVSGDPNQPRRSDGLIIPARDFLYFVGGLESTVELKLMVIERNPHGHRRLFHGLTITFDETNAMIAARLLLIPTNAKDHKEAGARTYPMDQAPDDVRRDLDDIRNRILFTLGQHFHCRVVGMDALRSEDMGFDLPHQRRQRGGAGADPDGNPGAGQQIGAIFENFPHAQRTNRPAIGSGAALPSVYAFVMAGLFTAETA